MEQGGVDKSQNNDTAHKRRDLDFGWFSLPVGGDSAGKAEAKHTIDNNKMDSSMTSLSNQPTFQEGHPPYPEQQAYSHAPTHDHSGDTNVGYQPPPSRAARRTPSRNSGIAPYPGAEVPPSRQGVDIPAPSINGTRDSRCGTRPPSRAEGRPLTRTGMQPPSRNGMYPTRPENEEMMPPPSRRGIPPPQFQEGYDQFGQHSVHNAPMSNPAGPNPGGPAPPGEEKMIVDWPISTLAQQMREREERLRLRPPSQQQRRPGSTCPQPPPTPMPPISWTGYRESARPTFASWSEHWHRHQETSENSKQFYNYDNANNNSGCSTTCSIDDLYIFKTYDSTTTVNSSDAIACMDNENEATDYHTTCLSYTDEHNRPAFDQYVNDNKMATTQNKETCKDFHDLQSPYYEAFEVQEKQMNEEDVGTCSFFKNGNLKYCMDNLAFEKDTNNNRVEKSNFSSSLDAESVLGESVRNAKSSQSCNCTNYSTSNYVTWITGKILKKKNSLRKKIQSLSTYCLKPFSMFKDSCQMKANSGNIVYRKNCEDESFTEYITSYKK